MRNKNSKADPWGYFVWRGGRRKRERFPKGEGSECDLILGDRRDGLKGTDTKFWAAGSVLGTGIGMEDRPCLLSPRAGPAVGQGRESLLCREFLLPPRQSCGIVWCSRNITSSHSQQLGGKTLFLSVSKMGKLRLSKGGKNLRWLHVGRGILKPRLCHPIAGASHQDSTLTPVLKTGHPGAM